MNIISNIYGRQTENSRKVKHRKNLEKETLKSPRQKQKQNDGPKASIERTVTYKDKKENEGLGSFPDIISDGFKILKFSGKSLGGTVATKKLFRQ